MIYRVTAGGDSYSALEFFLEGPEDADLESLWNEMMSSLSLESYDERWNQKTKIRWSTGQINALKELYHTLTEKELTGYNYVATNVFVVYLQSKGFTTIQIAEYEREH